MEMSSFKPIFVNILQHFFIKNRKFFGVFLLIFLQKICKYRLKGTRFVQKLDILEFYFKKSTSVALKRLSSLSENSEGQRRFY